MQRLKKIAEIRSSCLRSDRKIAALVIPINRVVTDLFIDVNASVNHNPIGISHCRSCSRQDVNIMGSDLYHYSCNIIHAEVSAIIKAYEKHFVVRGSVLLTTVFPCFNCAKTICTSGIKKVIYNVVYDGHQNEMEKVMYYFRKTGKIFYMVS